MKKLISIRVEEELLNMIEGNVSEFITDAVILKIFGDAGYTPPNTPKRGIKVKLNGKEYPSISAACRSCNLGEAHVGRVSTLLKEKKKIKYYNHTFELI